MQILQTLTPRWISPALAVGLALTVCTAALPAQEDQPSTGQIHQRIDRLIEQLGHEDYFVRQSAQAELARFSFKAFDALNAATTHEDLEVAARAKHLLGLMRVEWTTGSDPPEVQKHLAGYGSLRPTAKLLRIRALASLPGVKSAPALCRLVRYEKSPVLSKHAAIELLGSQPPDEPPNRQLAGLLRKNLGLSRRTAAAWLLTWVRFGVDPSAAVSDWAKLVEAEYSLLKQSRTQTDPSIVARLVRFQIQWLKKLDRKDETLAAMHRLIDLETGKTDTLEELLRWLIEQQAWESVDKLAARFPAQFASSPILLYNVAQAQARQGKNNQAEQTARRAVKLNPGNSPQQVIKHYAVARTLWQRGMFEWAQREYRQIIDTGTPAGPEVMAAHSLLGELLHDLGKELDAAKALEALVQAAEKKTNLSAMIRDRLPPVRSRMNYFFACHWQGRNDRAKQHEHLDKALKADPTDVDALIASYRLPDQTAEYREKTLGLIKQAAAKFRREITRAPDESTPCNQLAWLVANTEGDLDAALEYSRKSIQLRPTSAGFYDTLAHVYFARGDYVNAVKTQAKAARMEPHTKSIARQLEVFRKRLDETKKKSLAPGKPGG